MAPPHDSGSRVPTTTRAQSSGGEARTATALRHRLHVVCLCQRTIGFQRLVLGQGRDAPVKLGRPRGGTTQEPGPHEETQRRSGLIMQEQATRRKRKKKKQEARRRKMEKMEATQDTERYYPSCAASSHVVCIGGEPCRGPDLSIRHGPVPHAGSSPVSSSTCYPAGS